MKPILMPYEGRDVPHIVIEVNQTCNISCKACYKDKSNFSKPLDEIRREVDLAMSKRNLMLVSIAGGEPTLHPDLPEVIRYIAGKGLLVQLLTNGYDVPDSKWRQYKEAGLHGVFVHVDSLQNRPDREGMRTEADLHALRARLAQQVTRHGLHCFLAYTIYRSNLDAFEDVVRFALRNPDLQRILAICYADQNHIAGNLRKGDMLGVPVSRYTNRLEATVVLGRKSVDYESENVTSAQVKALLHEKLQMLPFAYIGSSKRDDEERWLFYYAFVITNPKKPVQQDSDVRVLHVGPAFGRLARWTNDKARRKGKPYSFGVIMNPARAVLACSMYALTCGNLAEAGRTLWFLLHLLKPGTRLLQKVFIVQQGPNVDADGELEYCKACPDATIRNGEMIPVCMADIFSPVDQSVNVDE